MLDGRITMSYELHNCRIKSFCDKTKKPSTGLFIFLYLFTSMAKPDSQEGTFFRDQIGSSGIDFRLENFPTNEKYLIETMTGGCGFLDYDADGLLDVFLVNGAAIRTVSGRSRIDKSEPKYWNRLYRNLGGGRFGDVTESAGVRGKGFGMGVAVGDYDNDGYPDLYVTNYGRNELYHNQGNGTFKDVTHAAGTAGEAFSTSSAFLDYNRDGLLDLYVCRYLDWSFVNNKVCGTSENKDYCSPHVFKGVPDLLFRNNGDGTFTDVSSAVGIALSSGKGLGIAIGDLDRDGWTDVYIANDGVPCFLFRNKEGKSFEEIGLNSATALNEHGSAFAGMGVDIADYDNDSWPDIFVTALSLEGFVLFQNNKDGTFSDVSDLVGVKKASFYLGGWGTKLLDFDNDGWKDLFVADGHVMRGVQEHLRTLTYSQPLLMLKNEQGRFSDVTGSMGSTFVQKWAARGAAFGDYDNDGDVDILVQVLGGRPLLLENVNGNGSHWLGIELIGRKSNRDAIGTAIKVVDNCGGQQHFSVARACSYLSSSDARIIVGLLGRSATSLEITWPSGLVQKVGIKSSNRYIRVHEGSDRS